MKGWVRWIKAVIARVATVVHALTDLVLELAVVVGLLRQIPHHVAPLRAKRQENGESARHVPMPMPPPIRLPRAYLVARREEAGDGVERLGEGHPHQPVRHGRQPRVVERLLLADLGAGGHDALGEKGGRGEGVGWPLAFGAIAMVD